MEKNLKLTGVKFPFFKLNNMTKEDVELKEKCNEEACGLVNDINFKTKQGEIDVIEIISGLLEEIKLLKSTPISKEGLTATVTTAMELGNNYATDNTQWDLPWREYLKKIVDILILPHIRNTEGVDVGELSPKYRLMIYFAHSTMVMYAKTIISNDKMSVGEFMTKNKDVIKRVFDEGLTIMEYELSHEQISRASLVYLQSKYFPSSVLDKPVYVPTKSN